MEYKKDVVKFRGCWVEKHFAAQKRELLMGGAAGWACPLSVGHESSTPSCFSGVDTPFG